MVLLLALEVRVGEGFQLIVMVAEIVCGVDGCRISDPLNFDC